MNAARQKNEQRRHFIQTKLSVRLKDLAREEKAHAQRWGTAKSIALLQKVIKTQQSGWNIWMQPKICLRAWDRHRLLGAGGTLLLGRLLRLRLHVWTGGLLLVADRWSVLEVSAARTTLALQQQQDSSKETPGTCD